MGNYTVYHCHSDFSNINGYMDSSTGFKEYIKLAKKQNMKALAFSEHGNIGDWIKKKQECDKVGIKYIHADKDHLDEDPIIPGQRFALVSFISPETV